MSRSISTPQGENKLFFVKNRRIYRKINGKFTPVPPDYLTKIPKRLQPMFLVLLSMNGGLPVTECYRVIAARLKVHIRTAQEYAYGLQDLGIIAIATRKIGPCRNGSNTFSFPELQGFVTLEPHGETTVEIQEQKYLKTTTQVREAKDSNQSPSTRALYDLNGVLMAENRSLRSLLNHHKPRFRGTEATVGVYTGPRTEMSEVEEREIRARVLAKEKEARDKHNRLMGRRI